MRRRPAIPALLAAAVLAAACSKKEDPCSADNQKAATASLVESWYLYPELLPAAIDLGAYHGPADLLDALTANARAAGKDRGWSYVTTLAAQQDFFAVGTSVGFGVGLLIRQDTGGGYHLYVSQVFAGSAAEGAGFERGDEIVAIGTADPLASVPSLIANDVQCQATTPDLPCNSLGGAFGPPTVGLQRLFDVIPLGASPPNPVRRTMIKATYGLDPVPTPPVAPAGTTVWPSGAVVIDRTAQGLSSPAGYFALRSFIQPADARLAAVVADLQAAGVTDVVIDLRYDGGGLLDTAKLLLNLLGGGLAGTVPMYELGFNPYQAAYNANFYFAPSPGAFAPDHVAFLVTDATASASELVPNALAPWKPVALVGHQTYGKPVGQIGWPSSQCGIVVYLVSFRISNGRGFGDYFQGLPASGFSGCGVAADDDLTHETWDPLETQTAAALQWLAGQWSGGQPLTAVPPSCPTTTLPLSAVAGPAARPADTYPQAVQPTEAQRHMRGLF